ncbi:MAG: hypothetical protein QXI89_00100 [Candidatus Anstonellales archaeon]
MAVWSIYEKEVGCMNEYDIIDGIDGILEHGIDGILERDWENGIAFALNGSVWHGVWHIDKWLYALMHYNHIMHYNISARNIFYAHNKYDGYGWYDGLILGLFMGAIIS